MEGPLQSPRPFSPRIKQNPFQTRDLNLATGDAPSVAPPPYSTTPYWQRLTMRVSNKTRSFHQGVAWKTLIFRPQHVIPASLLESYAPFLRIRNDRDNQTLLPDIRVYVQFTKLDIFFTLRLLQCLRPLRIGPWLPPRTAHLLIKADAATADLRPGGAPSFRHALKFDGSNIGKNPDEH